MKWYERAVHKGNTTAMFNLGIHYSDGNLGLTQSDTKANELIALAAGSLLDLNLMYLYFHCHLCLIFGQPWLRCSQQNKSKGTKEDHLEQEVTLVVDLQHGTARRDHDANYPKCCDDLIHK